VWPTKLRTKGSRWAILGLLLFWVVFKPLALLSICAYQRFVSPHKGWRCAYAVLHGGASCSSYGKEAISHYGILRGTLLVWDRLQDCRGAAITLAATSSHACDNGGNNCANGCTRGCTGGAPGVPTKSPPVSAPSTFVPPSPDAGRYRRFGWVDPEDPDRIHVGHDYDAPSQTPVRAIADGLVIDVRRHVRDFGGSNPSKAGPLMWIRHRTSTGEYFHALYGHAKPSVRKGQWVSAGDVVGAIIPFYDGQDAIPHLHLGIWQGKKPLPAQQLGYGPGRSFVDPVEFMQTHQPGSFRR